MLNKILLTAVLAVAFSATTAWGQECSICTGGTANGEYQSAGEYQVAGEYQAVDEYQAADEYQAVGEYQAADEYQSVDGCESCGVGQSYFDADAGCNTCGGSDRYLRLFVARNFTDDVGFTDFRDGWGAGLAFGSRKGRLRREVEFTYRNSSFDQIFGDTGSLNQASNMYNLLLDVNFIKLKRAQLYAGAGIGLSHANAEFDGIGSDSDTGFSYQAIAGLSRPLRIADRARSFVEYRYHSTQYNEFDVSIDNHSLFYGIELTR